MLLRNMPDWKFCCETKDTIPLPPEYTFPQAFNYLNPEIQNAIPSTFLQPRAATTFSAAALRNDVQLSGEFTVATATITESSASEKGRKP